MLGTSVLIEETAEGELRVVRADQVRERVGEVGRRLVSGRVEALRTLAEQAADQLGVGSCLGAV